MREFYIYPYNANSEAAILLSDKLDCYRINRQNSTFRRGPNKVIINWGNGSPLPTEVQACPLILNKWDNVAKAINKIDTFNTLIAARVKTVEYTRDKNTAQSWLNNNYSVFARQQTEGMDGQGIVLVKPGAGVMIPDAKFYTKAVISNYQNHPSYEIKEYRVNVFNGEAFSYQQKVKVSNRTDHDPYIRTTQGGWAFDVVEEHQVNRSVDAEAVAAVNALGLDFGGVDVLWSQFLGAQVLEVNTAPHLTPYTAGKFADALKDYLENLS